MQAREHNFKPTIFYSSGTCILYIASVVQYVTTVKSCGMGPLLLTFPMQEDLKLND